MDSYCRQTNLNLQEEQSFLGPKLIHMFYLIIFFIFIFFYIYIKGKEQTWHLSKSLHMRGF